MPSIFVTLVGGPPWGFRIQGGEGTGLPLRLSKVNPGSKAAEQGLLEGDVLKMVNGYLADKLNQQQVRDIIRDAGCSPLTLEIEREPTTTGQNEKVFTTTKTLILNSPTNSPTTAWIPNKDVIVERKISNELPQNSHDSRVQYTNGLRNGHYSDPMTSPPNRISPQHSSQKHLMNGDVELSFSGPPVVTSEPPPPGAVLVDEKVTVEGDKIHTDKYYAIPVKEVLKEKKSTTKFIPAPEKYEGIGPTEEGIPVSLRQSVKKENMSDWYKTMYKTLHKIDNEDDTYVIGYSSDPEIRKEEKHPPPPKHELLSQSNATTPEKPVSPIPQVSIHKYPTKSTINVYSAHPRPIEDYEPGYSSVTDRELDIGSKRYFPTNKLPKTSYEFRDGYESDSSILKKFNQPDDLDFNQQKILYREVQQGGEIPQFGLRKPAPEKPKDPVVGPPPPQPHNYEPYRYPEVTRPLTLPPDYLNNNINNNSEFSQQANGFYATQMRNAIHTELQQKGFQTSPLSPNSISVVVKPTIKPVEKKMLARVLFDFVAETPKELNLKKDDIVSIRRELDKNWYEGERKGQIGIFPISYVEILPPEHVSPVPKKIQEGLAKVMYDFPAHNSIELQAKKDEEIHLVRKVDHNWYEARIGSRKGIIPRTYINVIHEPDTGSSKSQQPSLSPGLKDARSTSSMSPLSETSLSPHTKTNGVTPSQNGPPSQNGHVSRTKKGNKLIEPVLYKALYRYSPQNADELQLIEGDNVYVIEMCDDGWYVGTSVRTGELGIIPGNYMEKV